MQKIFFSKSAWKDGVYQLQCCGSFQAERRETTSRAIGGPVSGLVNQTPVNSDTDNGSQEDDRGKLVYLLSFS